MHESTNVPALGFHPTPMTSPLQARSYRQLTTHFMRVSRARTLRRSQRCHNDLRLHRAALPTTGGLPMASAFPWPVTDDELLLTNALAEVMQACRANEDAAANLIIEAYNQGVREQKILVDYALEKLQQGRTA
jgi:hypothetical protein